VLCRPRWGSHQLPCLGQGPRGHETLHYAAVSELMLDGVGVVQASLLQELFEVVCGRPRLTLAAASGCRDAHHPGAAYLLANATVAIGCNCGLLVVLLAPPLAALGALHGVLDGDVMRHFPTAAQGWEKLERFIADGVLGGDATPLLGGALGDVGRCLERMQQWYVARVASRHPKHCPLGSWLGLFTH
jgi:hypothetical protein